MINSTIDVDDATFVRAPVALVYRRITDVAAWPTWWTGLRVHDLPPLSGDERWGVSLRVGPARLLRFALTCTRWRHEAGLQMRLDGDLDGRAEFWLEPASGGTVVHHVAAATTGLRWPRRTAQGYRRAVRRGLWGFKDVLQLETRTSLGVLP
jgi:hypothetical protein